MVTMAQENGAWFLVDEMYRGLEHSSSFKPLPAVADCMDRGISLSGMSKSYGLPGLRIGWVVNFGEKESKAFHNRVSELKDYTTICPPAPSEALAFIALRSQDALWERSREILETQLPILRRFVQRHSHSLQWCEPTGGTFAWVKFQPSTGVTASAYCDAVRRRTGLMMVPSGLFPECQTSDDRIRLTYGKKGLDQLLQVWEQDLQRNGC